MKKLVTYEEVDSNTEGLDGLLGSNVVVWCMNYIYSGTLVGVNDKFIKLDDAGVVYETGKIDAVELKNFQKLPKGKSLYIQTCAIECFYER